MSPPNSFGLVIALGILGIEPFLERISLALHAIIFNQIAFPLQQHREAIVESRTTRQMDPQRGPRQRRVRVGAHDSLNAARERRRDITAAESPSSPIC